MSRTVTKKPQRIRMNGAELTKKSADKLRQEFGPRTYLGKHEIAPVDRVTADGDFALWSVITFVEIGKYKVHGKGKSAREAIEDAGLGGWLEDAERGLV